jgi:hypothetical protein
MQQFSKFFAINGRDLVKGLIVAVLATVLSSLVTIIEAGQLPTADQWKAIGMMAAGAGLSYFLKNFLTNSEDKFLSPDPKPEAPKEDEPA